MTSILDSIDDISSKKIIIGGDFTAHLDTTLESKGGKPTLKKQIIVKFIEILENFDLCDI